MNDGELAEPAVILERVVGGDEVDDGNGGRRVGDSGRVEVAGVFHDGVFEDEDGEGGEDVDDEDEAIDETAETVGGAKSRGRTRFARGSVMDLRADLIRADVDSDDHESPPGNGDAELVADGAEIEDALFDDEGEGAREEAIEGAIEAPGVSRKVRKRTKRDRPRSKTIAMKRVTRAELAMGAMMYPPVEGVQRPRTRAECSQEARPCPWVSCKHHLYLDINPETGSIKINFPDLEPWEMKHTCSLDVADAGALTLEEIGFITNLTRERIRQVEVRGLLKLKVRRELR